MPDNHVMKPIPYRPTAATGLREWLISHQEATGRPMNAIINDAVAEYRLHHSVNGAIVIHKDGDPLNNDPANLEIRKGEQQ